MNRPSSEGIAGRQARVCASRAPPRTAVFANVALPVLLHGTGKVPPKRILLGDR